MSRNDKICALSLARFRNYSSCHESAEYRARATLNTGREFVLYLCPVHMPHAWELAQVLMERRFANAEAEHDLRLECISFHQLNPVRRLTLRKKLGTWVA
jgi:hypothetical protein